MRRNYANRGKAFETLIETTNRNYANSAVANIQKIPTPIRVTRMKNGRIVDGFFEKKSTVDYKGVYNGRSIHFETKSSELKTSFNLGKIEPHQFHDLKFSHQCGGVAFVLIEFAAHQDFYLVPYIAIEKMVENGQKSISYHALKTGEIGFAVHYDPIIGFLDYLKIVHERMDLFGIHTNSI